MILLDLAMSVLGIGKDYVDAKMEQRKAEVEAKTAVTRAEGEAKAALLVKAADAEASWDAIMAKNSETSWKDEFWTIVLSIPLIMAFIPGLAEYVQEGFTVLSGVPDWYFYSILTAIAGAFGFRAVTRLTRK